MDTNNEDVTKGQPASADKPVDKEGTSDAGAGGGNEQKDVPIDYKAEYEAEKTRREGAEQTIIDNKRKAKAAPDDEELDATIDEKVDRKVNEKLAERVSDEIDSVLSELSDNPDEREFIKFHYQHTIQKTGFSRTAIRSDLQNAQVLANRKKIDSENRELRESLRSKNTTGSGTGMGTNQDRPAPVVEKAPQRTPQEMAILERRGIDPVTLKKKVSP